MTDYAGELYRITVTAKDFASKSVAPADIDSMKVIVYNAANEIVVPLSEMAYVELEGLWEYIWLTVEDGVTSVLGGGVALPAGTYKARCILIDLDNHPSWEYKRHRLKSDPLGVS